MIIHTYPQTHASSQIIIFHIDKLIEIVVVVNILNWLRLSYYIHIYGCIFHPHIIIITVYVRLTEVIVTLKESASNIGTTQILLGVSVDSIPYFRYLYDLFCALRISNIFICFVFRKSGYLNI